MGIDSPRFNRGLFFVSNTEPGAHLTSLNEPYALNHKLETSALNHKLETSAQPTARPKFEFAMLAVP